MSESAGQKRRTSAGKSSNSFLLREARVAEALREVAEALGTSLEVEELIEIVLSKLRDLLDSEEAILFLLDEKKRELISHPVGEAESFSIQLGSDRGFLSLVVRTGRVAQVDVLCDSEFIAEWEAFLGHRSRSALAAPLKNNLSRTIGVLLVLDKKGGCFDSEDSDFLSLLSKQTAVAIDNSRLLVKLIRKNQQLSQAQEQLTRRVRDLELLFDLERSTAHAESHEQLARAVLESLAKACNAGGALLVLAEEGPPDYLDYSLQRAPRVIGETKEGEASFQVRASTAKEGILAPVFVASVPIQLDRIDSPLLQEGLADLHSMIAEPLEGDDAGPLGALALVNKRGGPFTAEDLGLLRLVSANLSTAVRLFNAKHVKSRQERLSSIGRLLSQVVHDLKSPLTVISGYVQLMEDSPKREERKGYAAEILKQFKAMGAMQREVLAFARGETEIFARRVILDRLLSDLEVQMRAELAERHVELKISASAKIIVHLDSERLMRALLNLIRNAVEAMAPQGGGTISVRATAEGETLMLRVSDTGPGIPEEIAPRLFQSFVTLGKSEGTGLGLAIVKRIVEEHGGTVSQCSRGEGACFLLTLPGAVESSGNGVSSAKKGAARKKAVKKGAVKKKAVNRKKAVKKGGSKKTSSGKMNRSAKRGSRPS